MNKPTSWPKRLRCCIHLAFRCLFETPSDFSGTNCDRREFPLLQTWLLSNLGLVCSMAKDVLSYLGLRVWHVSESSLDMITCKPICLKLAWLIHRSALCKSVPMTGEHLSDCSALLHVLSQDNCGVLPARVTSALYWTARHPMFERTLAGLSSGEGPQASNPPFGVSIHFPQESPALANISDPFEWIEQHLESALYDLNDFAYVDSESDDSDYMIDVIS
ncbi:hypothetical protein TNCV_2846521 [Trichonephila clavipes]|nr:hypothetical protein TNCV_2846521 [Trichonephila clavipes]